MGVNYRPSAIQYGVTPKTTGTREQVRLQYIESVMRMITLGHSNAYEYTLEEYEIAIEVLSDNG